MEKQIGTYKPNIMIAIDRYKGKSKGTCFQPAKTKSVCTRKVNRLLHSRIITEIRVYIDGILTKTIETKAKEAQKRRDSILEVS